MNPLAALLSPAAETPAPDIAESVEKTANESLGTLKALAGTDAMQHIASSLVNFTFRLAIAIGVFLLGKFLIKRLYKWLRKVLIHKGTDASLTSFVLSLVKITLFFILIISVIGILGLETSSFMALFASAGVAVGLALSGTLQNFAGGVLILLLKPYKVGDFIEAQGFSGTVKEIQIFNTIINTPDNKAIIIPNGPLSTSSINNFSLEDRRRIDWTVGVAYGTDFEHARDIITGILAAQPEIETDPAPAVFINELADSAVNFTVRAWCPTAKYWDIYFRINELLYRKLPEAGIEFPFPQMDVHLSKAAD